MQHDSSSRYLAIVMAALLVVSAACGDEPQRAEDRSASVMGEGDGSALVAIHPVASSEAGIFVNAYLVEGRRGVIAVDSALTVSEAARVRSELDRLGKPLVAVLVTHGHPDHYNGVGALVAGRAEVPVYATAGVARVIRESDAAKEAQWRPTYGDEWPGQRVFPTRELASGASVVLDDLRFTVTELGPGESDVDTIYRLDAGQGHVFLGDVVLHGEHAYVTDGHTRRWLDNLAQVGASLKGGEILYPGHGRSGGAELLGWQREYLRAYRDEVQGLRGGAAQLDEVQKRALTERMVARYPDAGLTFLIALGADAVARELAQEAR